MMEFFPSVVFYGHAIGHVFLDGVLDLVELLTHVIGGIVLCSWGSSVAVGVLFPPAVNAPQEGRDKGKDPEHDEDGAEQRNQVVWGKKNQKDS